jgi:hypothetical protein
MGSAPRFCFYVNRHQPAADDVNADVREEVAANGYCLFAIGLKLDVLKRSRG